MTYYSTPTRPDEIWHHGIKGMHWGIRKYQNEDGSLTEAGKKRYYKYKDDIEIARKSLAESRKARSDKKSYEAFRPYLDARRRIANRIYTKDGTSLFRGGPAIDYFGSPANNRRAREAIALTDRLIKNANFDDMPKRRKKRGSGLAKTINKMRAANRRYDREGHEILRKMNML